MGKSEVIERLSEACATEKGFLTIVKVGNLIENGVSCDEAESVRIQSECVRIIDSSTEKYDIKGCIGTDEFVIFFKDMENKEGIEDVYAYIGQRLNELAARYSNETKKPSVDISMGAVMVPANGTDYTELFEKADKALEESEEKSNVVFYDLEDSGKKHGAMNVDYDTYKVVREYMNNFCDTYQSVACELILSFEPTDEDVDYDDFEKAYRKAEDVVMKALRKSDVMTVTGNKIRALLPEITMQNTIVVINRIKGRLKIKRLDDVVSINVTSQMLGPEREYPVWMKAVI